MDHVGVSSETLQAMRAFVATDHELQDVLDDAEREGSEIEGSGYRAAAQAFRYPLSPENEVTYTFIYVSLHGVCVCVCVCVLSYTHTHTRARAHTHTHLLICVFPFFPLFTRADGGP